MTRQEYEALTPADRALVEEAYRDAMLVKLADLRHNTDIRRLKGITIKDRERMARYHSFAFDIQQRLNNA